MAGRLRKENLKHRKAFEFYAGLGTERTLKKVAQQFKVSEPSIHAWKRSFKWDKRVAKRDDEIADRMRKASIAAAEDSITSQLKIAQTIRVKFQNLLDKDLINISVSDVLKASQHELLLSGHPTSREEHRFESGALAVAVSAIIDAINRTTIDRCPHCGKDSGARDQVVAAIKESAGRLTAAPDDKTSTSPEARA